MSSTPGIDLSPQILATTLPLVSGKMVLVHTAAKQNVSYSDGYDDGYSDGYAQGLLDADTSGAYNSGYAAGYTAALARFLLGPAPATDIVVTAEPEAIGHVSAALSRLASMYGDDVDE